MTIICLFQRYCFKVTDRQAMYQNCSWKLFWTKYRKSY